MSPEPVGHRALIVATLLLGVAVLSAQQTFKSGVSLVHVPVVVTGKDGALVRGLTKDDFRVTEDGTEQAVQFFADGGGSLDKLALHLGLLLDVSESMGPPLAQAQTAAIRFVNALDEAHDTTLVDFDHEVRVARFDEHDYPRMFERIRSKKAGGSTALYDAIGMYLRSTQGQEGQRVLLLYTDGGDNTSALNFGQLEKLLKQDDVLVYSIGYVDKYARPGQPQMQLTTLAKDTGGDAFFPDGIPALNEIYARILDELGSRYTLGYLPTNATEDGKYRKIEVRVTKPEAAKAKVRARPGYYAPGAGK